MSEILFLSLAGVVGAAVLLQVLYLVIRRAVRDGILAADAARGRVESDRRRQEALAEARRTTYRLDPPD
jgi:hypothetical protein